MVVVVMVKLLYFFWMLIEGCVIFEFVIFGLFRKSMCNLFKGDGYLVLVLFGFMVSDYLIWLMWCLFDDFGYNVYGWGLGCNVKFNE